MNTSKQINIMVALVFIAVIATGAYTLWDPSRAADAKQRQLDKTVNRGAFLFSQNCRVCHGNAGQGGAAANLLKAAPPLNRADLQGKDPTTGAVDPTLKANEYKLIYFTILCGRVGKAMPTWSDVQGGPLNEEQIKQLTTMIIEGTGWGAADEYALNGVPADKIPGELTDGFKLAAPLDASSTVVQLNKVGVLAKGDRLRIDNELMTVTEVNKDANSVTVNRPLGTTKAAAHENGAPVAKPPIPPDPPSITGSSGPVCGQYAPPPQPTPAAPAAPATELKLTAKGIQFDTAALTGAAAKELTITVDNQDSGVLHNINFFEGTDNTGQSVGATPIESGPVVQTLKLGPLDAGTYYYQCDVHPAMSGTLTVQ